MFADKWTFFVVGEISSVAINESHQQNKKCVDYADTFFNSMGADKQDIELQKIYRASDTRKIQDGAIFNIKCHNGTDEATLAINCVSKSIILL